MNTKRSISWCFVSALLGLAGLVSNSAAADPPWLPVVHLLATDPLATEEGTDPATFTVIRIGPTNESLTVQYQVGGSAENGVDYQTLSGAVTIPPGAFTAPITVTPIEDFLVEGGESVIGALEQPLLWPPPYLVSWPSLAFAHLRDNDAPATNRPPHVVIVNPPAGAVFEAGIDLVLVARAHDPDGVVQTVEFFDGTNRLGVASNLPVLLPTADSEFERDPDVYPDLDVTVNTTPIPIPVNLFRLTWSNVPPGTHVLTAVATDNDGATARSLPIDIRVVEPPTQPVVTVVARDWEAAEPNPTSNLINTATFAVIRRGATNFPLTVYYQLSGTASNGVDYEELPTSVVIPEGARAASVVVEPRDDNLVEGLEAVVLTILPPVCIAIYPPPEDCYLVGRPHVARAVIRDNDAPSNHPPLVRIVRPLDGSVFRAPADLAIVADAQDRDGRVVQVEFFEGTNSLGVVSNHPAILRPGLPVFALVWSNVPPGRYILTAEATDNEGTTMRSQPVDIHVVPHSIPPVVSVLATDPEGAEVTPPGAPNPAVFSVRRAGSLAEPLLVFYRLGGSASNGVDYRPLFGRVLIPSGSNSAPVVIEPIDDNRLEGTETVVLMIEPPPTITLSNVTRLDHYIIGSNHLARAIIRDNDLTNTNLPPRVAIVRPEDGEMFIAPADIGIYVAASDPDGWVRSVEFFEGTNSLGIISNNLASGPTTNPPEQLFRFIWSNVTVGAYGLTAKATDNHGASARSEPVHIRVVDHPVMPMVTIHATDPYASEGNLIVTGTNGHGGINTPLVTNRLGNEAVFTVRRSAGTNDELMVFYEISGTASNGVDYRRLSGEIVIPRGAWTASIMVDPIDDPLDEPTETVVAALRPVACPAVVPPPPGCYRVGDPGRATAFIYDNDMNRSPRAEIVQPHDLSIFVAPADIEIGVLAVDPDGWVARVEFYEGTNQIGAQEVHFIVPPPPGQVQRFSMLWSNVPVGAYVLTAKAIDQRGAASRTDPVRVTVVPRTPLPVVNIEAVDPVATEPNPLLTVVPDTARFVVRRFGGDLTRPLPVIYRISGTASNGQDYRELTGVVVIESNAPAADIVVVPLHDERVEGTENVLLTLTQPPCVTNTATPHCYIVGRPDRALAYIRDNDSPSNRPPTVAILSPPNGAVYTAPVDLRLVAAANDPDGWVTTVEFFAGTHSLGVVSNRPWILDTRPVRLPEVEAEMLPDLSPIAPFILIWSNVPPGRHLLSAVATDNLGESSRSRPVEIVVREANETPVVRLFTVDAFAREGTTNTAAFRVRRSGRTNESLSLAYTIRGSASNGVDYLTLPGTVTIPAGRRSVRLVVTPIDDRIPEWPETVILRLLPSPVDPPGYVLGRPHVAAAVIVDNDRPRLTNERLMDGSLHVNLPLANGLPFRLEASINLLDWEAVMSGVVSEETIEFVDGEQDQFPHRFFRVIPEYEPQEDDE